MCFDSGPDSKSIIRNIKALNLDEKVRQTEEFVLSHWHADHSGGLLGKATLSDFARGLELNPLSAPQTSPGSWPREAYHY
jgi:metal-dependent hydrolase (beta-lactamase superfamily II)